jgi:predicted ATPase/class 3 adenylate cyclase
LVSAEGHLPSGLVTFLFTDIEGSTRLAQVLGAQYRAVLMDHRRILRETLLPAGGHELSAEGDSLFVVFADARSALTACATAQRALAAHAWPPRHAPRVRMGLHTGPAEPYAGEYTSPEVHRAARIATAAHGGQVLCSEATAQAAANGATSTADVSLDDLGLHRLRGFDGRERLYQLAAAGLERRFPRPRGVAAAAHNLPVPVTGFIGRDAEQRDLRALLARHRFVAVIGPGGAGKTRLAVEVAAALVARHPDGVWFADFAHVADADLVEVCVADALGLRPEPGRALADTLVDHVAGRRLLLVLDTCDAYPAAVAAMIGRLVSGGVGVSVLATSREPLGLPGEVVWRIPPLGLRPTGSQRHSDAVALLLDRAEAARGGRPVEPDELGELARVAAAMNGLPLALELAAARLRVLSAAQLAARVDDVTAVTDAGTQAQGGAGAAGGTPPRPGVPPPRHRTMDATLEWSYRTLPPDAARLLRWLSVFAGPVDLSTVETVLGADPLDPVTTLVDKSLLQSDGAAYRMLDPIRSYAARRLRAAGEERTARNRHVAWCRLATRQANLDADGHPVTLSLHALDPLADEVRAALRWTAIGGSARAGLFLARALDQWWRERGLAREGRRWLTRLYDRLESTPPDDSVPDGELAAVYHLHSLLAGADGEYAEELAYSRRAEDAAYRADDPALLARVLAGRGAPLLDVGRVDDAERVCRDTIEWATRAGVAGEALFAVYCLAELLWQRRDLDAAAALLASARPLEAARPAERGRRTVDMILGLVALERGDLVAAHDHLVVALRSRVSNGFLSRAGETLSAMAVRCALGGDPLTAARLFGAAQASRTRLRVSPGVLGPYWAEHLAAVRAALGDAVFDSAYSEGSALSVERAAAVALAVEHPDLAAGSKRFSRA